MRSTVEPQDSSRDTAPLGATSGPHGTNFAVSSEGEQVTLCLFDADGAEERLALPERDGDARHGFVLGVEPGQLYGFRVSGPYDLARGLRYNPAGCRSTGSLGESRAGAGRARMGGDEEITLGAEAAGLGRYMPRGVVLGARPPVRAPGHSTRSPTCCLRCTFAGSPPPIPTCHRS